MPDDCEDDYCVAEIDCSNGIYQDTKGYVVFMKGNEMRVDDENEETEEEQLPREAEIAKLYRELVFRPWIQRIRTLDYGWDGIGAVPDYLKCVSWQDGAGGQLTYLKRDDVMEYERDVLKIEVCKHSAARSGMEQACDIAPIFRELKRMIHLLVDCNSKINESAWLRYVDTKVRDLKMNLPGWKIRLLVAVIGTLPQCIASAYTKKNIMAGFFGNGMIDEKSRSVPDAISCLETLRVSYFTSSDTLQDKCDHIKMMVNTILPLYIQHGYPPESSYTAISIDMDKDENGDDVPKRDNISSESVHRAKPLSSSITRYHMHHKLYQIEFQKYTSAVNRKEMELKLVETANECEMIMVEWVRRFKSEIGTPSVIHIDVDVIKKSRQRDYNGVRSLTNVHMEAFLRTRNPVRITRSTGNPRYYSVGGKNKATLIEECVSCRGTERWELQFQALPLCPEPPVRPAVAGIDLEQELIDMDDVQEAREDENNNHAAAMDDDQDTITGV